MEKTEFEQLKEKIKINFLQIEKILAKYDDRLKDAERELVKLGDVARKFEELNRSVEELKRKTEADIGRVEKEIGNLKEISGFGEKLPEIERKLKEIERKIEEWRIFAEEFNKNKDIYIELREAVISSIEYLKEKEKIFDKNLEEFSIISKKFEENERIYEKMSSEIREQLSVLKEENKKMREEIENFKEKFARMSEMKAQEEENKIESFDKELVARKVDEYIENKIKVIEKEIIPKKIDEGINHIIEVISEKTKNFVPLSKFEELRSEMMSYLRAVREPDVKNLEEKIAEIEKDIVEIRRLIRNFSSRLPIVVE